MAGLAYRHLAPPVYSAFSQLLSVWLGIGVSLGGAKGGILATPLLGAGAVMTFYLLARRLSGVGTALAAAGLLAPALPQLLFARVSTGEIGAQFFLWSELLALARWGETRARAAALGAGVGFGLAGLARPELMAFLPLAILLSWVMSPRDHERLPALTLGATAALFAHAVWLLAILPSHYHGALLQALVGSGVFGTAVAAPLPVVLAAGVAWVGARVAAGRESAGPQVTLGSWRALAVCGVPFLAGAWWRVSAGRLAVLLGGVAAATSSTICTRCRSRCGLAAAFSRSCSRCSWPPPARR